jgi:hypothetical protein
MRRSTIATAALLLCAASCSSDKKPACGVRDAGVVEVGIEPPAGCPPAEANELGIGKPCTMCGNECASPLRCTCDAYLGVQLAGVPCVCTLLQLAQIGSINPCAEAPANFCGTNATCCNVLNSAAYCVPDICLIDQACIVFTPLDAGTDGDPDAAGAATN